MNVQLRLASIICCIVLPAAACSSSDETATAELPTIESSTTTAPVADAADPTGDEASATASEEEQGDGTPADDGPVDPEIAFADYEQCMADLGVEIQIVSATGGSDSIETLDEIPEDAVLGSEFDPEEFEAAEEECGPILEGAFGSFEMSPEQEAEMADEMLEMERCLADQGFDIDMNGGSFEIGGEDFDFDTFDDAMSTCGSGLIVGPGQ